MATLTFDVTVFRTQFKPAFDNEVDYPTSQLQIFWNNATGFISTNDCYGYLTGQDRLLALNLMTAHLATLWTMIKAGITPQLITGSTIDKITVTLTPPPLRNQYAWWLQTTPYGMELYALLQANSVGGWYVGGSPVLAGFPRPGNRYY